MNMDELYREMKDALDYLGLRFHQMNQAEVTLCGDRLCFTWNGRSVSVAIPEAK